MQHFTKEEGVDSKEEQADMELDPDEEEMDDGILDNKIERRWMMVFKDNDGRVYNEKTVIYTKRWYFCKHEKKALIKGGYSVKVSVSDGKKFLWGVLDNHVGEEGKEYDGIGLRWFGFNVFDKDKEGVVSEGLSEYPYLLMLMKLWPG